MSLTASPFHPTRSRWAHRLRAMLGRNRASLAAAAKPLFPEPPPPAEWEDAFIRVESYLRAHQITGRMQLIRLTSEIIAAARMVAVDHPEEQPVTLAIRMAQARIGEWLMQALGEGDWTEERWRARGRLALILSGLPWRQPELFLTSLPEDLRARMAQARLYAGPELSVTGMPPAPLEFPLKAVVEEKWVTFSRSTFLRAAGGWALLLGVLGGVWFFIR